MPLAKVSDRRTAFLDFHSGEQNGKPGEGQAEKGEREMVVIGDHTTTVKELIRCIFIAHQNLEGRGKEITHEALLEETMRIIDATEAATRKLLELCFRKSKVAVSA